MQQYRATGKVSYATSDRDGDAKPYSEEFEAQDDAAARRIVKDLPGVDGSWDKVTLVRIDTVEEVTPLEL